MHHNYIQNYPSFFMGKRKVLNESELKEIRLQEEQDLHLVKLTG